MVSFDTNILVYATLSAPLAKTHRARDLFVRGMRTGSSILLLQTLAEFSSVAIRKAGIGVDEVRTTIDAWRSVLPVTALSDRRSDVGVREIVPFKQQRFTCELCERVGKAIAEVQLGGMAAAFAEIAIGLACNSSLGFGYGLNDDLRLFDQVVEAPAGDGVTARVYDDRGFHEISG